MKTPWRKWQHVAFVQLGWSPREFWDATPFDLLAALGNTQLLDDDTLKHLDELRRQT
jgi:hypothetical protein